MRLPLADSFRALVGPGLAFKHPPTSLGRAVGGMALVWMPLAALNTAWLVRLGLRGYSALRHGAVPPEWLGPLGLDPGGLPGLIATLPPPPTFGRLLPWILLLVPLGVLGTWLHHAVWDHAALWLLGGLKHHRGFRISLLAEAEALRIAAAGTLVGLLGYLPGAGGWLALPLLLLDVYLWLFRGFALAARHGCEPWRGIAATVVHVVLLGCMTGGLFVMMLFMARLAV